MRKLARITKNAIALPPVAEPLPFSWSVLLPVPGYPGWYIGPYFPETPPGVVRFLVVAENVIGLRHQGFPSLSAIPAGLLVLGQKRNHHRQCWDSDPCVWEYVTEPELSARRTGAKAYVGDMVEALGKYLSMDRAVPHPGRAGIEKSLPRGDRDETIPF